MDGPLLNNKGLLNFDFKPSEFIEDEVTVARLQAMKEAINRGAIVSVVNGEFRMSRNGKILICGTGGNSGKLASYPFRIKGTSRGGTGQVQCNGGDGALASLSPTDGTTTGIACVNGVSTDTATGSPPVYPQLAIPANGIVYEKSWLNTLGQVTPGSSAGGTGVDVLYAATLPAPDTANPPTYGIKILASISNYASVGGIVSFTVNNANGPVGITTVAVCGGVVTTT